MVIRLSLFFLAFISFLAPTFAQEVHLFVKSNGVYYAANKSKVSDTGIIVDEKLAVFLTHKQFKSIVEEGKVVRLSRIPATTLNWNQWHTHQIYTEYFSQEATLENGKIVIKDKQTAEEKEFLNLSLYLIASFLILMFFSSLFRENSKVELHKFILALAAIVSIFICLWTLLIVPFTFPVWPSHISNLIIISLIFNVFSFLGVLILHESLSSRYARVASVASMIVVGLSLLIM